MGVEELPRLFAQGMVQEVAVNGKNRRVFVCLAQGHPLVFPVNGILAVEAVIAVVGPALTG